MALQHHKARARENFPVASWLLPRTARPIVLAFYDFARGADDIADHQTMGHIDKISALTALAQALEHGDISAIPPWAHDYVAQAAAHATPAIYGRQLLQAFSQDTHKTRYANLQELQDYCAFSAVPVGRMLRHACGDTQPSDASDALCEALQLLNHLQDIRSDYVTLNRIYLPQDWMNQAGAKDDMLAHTACSDAVRQVIDRLLDYIQQRLSDARMCHQDQSQWGTRFEVAIIWQIAWALSEKLRCHDPHAKAVKLSKLEYARCVWRACKVNL